ncbi:MAG TPA: hypothetical protein VGE36_04410 [Roseateles sp.]
MTGAPVLNGVAAALIGVLDACLKDGFGIGTVDSITIAGGVATVQRSAGHPMEVGTVALIAGATVSGGDINGEQKVTAATSTTYQFDATGLANQTATGTITHKVAPLGWAKTGSGNLAAYKPTDPAATGCMLRVDDSGTTLARIRGFETMSDINTGLGLFPTDAAVSGGLYWPKSSSSDATARAWILVGDGRLFYLMVAYQSTAGQVFGFNHVFGDINAVKSPDAFACLVHGMVTSSGGTAGNNSAADFDDGNGTAQSTGTYLPRSYVGVGGNIAARKSFPLIVGSSGGKSGNTGMPYPNNADGGLYLSPYHVIDHASGVYRGVAPGLYAFPQMVGPTSFGSRDRLEGVSGYSGKVFRVVNSAVGCFAFDTTGPWR